METFINELLLNMNDELDDLLLISGDADVGVEGKMSFEFVVVVGRIIDLAADDEDEDEEDDEEDSDDGDTVDEDGQNASFSSFISSSSFIS